MKQVLLIGVLLLSLAGTSSAQTKNGKHKRAMHKHTVAAKTTRSSSSNHAALNQREMYHWQNGQAATPTGNEATGINETQAVSKDANKIKGSARGTGRGGKK
jgi:hypothetical protein